MDIDDRRYTVVLQYTIHNTFSVYCKTITSDVYGLLCDKIYSYIII